MPPEACRLAPAFRTGYYLIVRSYESMQALIQPLEGDANEIERLLARNR